MAALALTRLEEALHSDDVLTFLVRDTGGTLPRRDGFTFREAKRSDAAIYARDIGTDSAGTFRARLGGSTRCYVVESAGRLVHATWTTTSAAWTRELQRYFVCPQGDIYIFESYTRPEMRGRGVYPLAIASMAAVAGESGRSRMWVGIEGHNPASYRAVTKAGFRDAFRVAYARRLARLTVGDPTGPLADVGRACIVPRDRLPDEVVACAQGGGTRKESER